MTKQVHRASELEIIQKVTHQIDREPRLEDCPIQVETNNGVVVLKGAVPGVLAREIAETAARRVPGVLDVANDLVVVPRAAEDRSDADVAADVRRALQDHPGVRHETLRCSVTGGAVTLTGELDRWTENVAAEDAVNSVAGVRSLENLVQVKESVAPRQVHKAIVRALVRHALEEASNLTVTTFGDEVTITGVVNCSIEKRVLLEAARRVPGVKGVKSQVRVSFVDLVPPTER